LLGRYENFPEMYHGVIRFHHQTSEKKLQEFIIKALHDLGQEGGFDFPTIHAVSDCEVEFDFGIADGAIFNYLDRETLTTSVKTISEYALPVLDFLGVVRYYKKGSTRDRRPLKFDYYFLRFLFHDGSVDFQIFHERGTRRLSMEDLSAIIIKRVDRELSEVGLPKVTVEETRTL